MPKETAREWELRQRVDRLANENNGLRTQLRETQRAAQKAQNTGYDKEREAIELGHQLRSEKDRAASLEAALQKLREVTSQTASDVGGFEGRALQAEATLAEEISRRQTSKTRNTQLGSLVIEQEEVILAQRQQLEEARGVRTERDGLVTERSFLVGRVHSLQSQVGNVFTAGNDTLRTYYRFEALKGLPIIGKLFERASQRAYQAYQDSKRK